MTSTQKIIRYFAVALAVLLAVSIVGGVLRMFGIFGRFFNNDAVTGEVLTYSVSPDIKRLHVEINAADFTIKQGDRFAVESNLKYLTVEDKNGVLTIKETQKFSSKYTGALLTLFVPANTTFQKADITTGAGRLTADYLSADTLKLVLGAGEVRIDTLIALSAADIDGGAGKITVSGGALRHLDLDMGVGQLNLTTKLTGESDLDLGIGESNITVIGNRADYRLDVEKGLGTLTVDGSVVSSIKERGNGENEIDINGGIGAINLAFKASDAG